MLTKNTYDENKCRTKRDINKWKSQKRRCFSIFALPEFTWSLKMDFGPSSGSNFSWEATGRLLPAGGAAPALSRARRADETRDWPPRGLRPPCPAPRLSDRHTVRPPRGPAPASLKRPGWSLRVTGVEELAVLIATEINTYSTEEWGLSWESSLRALPFADTSPTVSSPAKTERREKN